MTGHTTASLLNTSVNASCTPSFVPTKGWSSPCSGVGQGLLLTNSTTSLNPPFTFSALAHPILVPDFMAILGTLLGGSPLTENNAVYTDSSLGGYVDLTLAGSTEGGGYAGFALANATSHVIISVDDTKGVQVYLNGTRTSTAPYSGDSAATSLPLTIGNNVITTEPDDNTFVGVLRDMRVFARGLNATEAAILYTVDVS